MAQQIYALTANNQLTFHGSCILKARGYLICTNRHKTVNTQGYGLYMTSEESADNAMLESQLYLKHTASELLS